MQKFITSAFAIMIFGLAFSTAEAVYPSYDADPHAPGAELMFFRSFDERARVPYCDFAETQTLSSYLNGLKSKDGWYFRCREDLRYGAVPYRGYERPGGIIYTQAIIR